MPAIEISRLRTKISLLTRLIDTPDELVRELLQFYESYSDLTFQSGTFSVRAGDYPAFRTPTLMNREIETAFAKFATTDPQKTIELIDLLAKCPQLEPRQLACTMLGTLPQAKYPLVTQRLDAWSHATEEPEDLIWMFDRGTKGIRREQPELWLKMLQGWLEANNAKSQSIAVYGLSSMINDTDLTSLPLIFKYLQPLLVEANPRIIPHLETIVVRLIEKSEKETLFFLKQTIRQSSSPVLNRMIRLSLPLFSPEGQESLRSFLRAL